MIEWNSEQAEKGQRLKAEGETLRACATTTARELALDLMPDANAIQQ